MFDKYVIFNYILNVIKNIICIKIQYIISNKLNIANCVFNIVSSHFLIRFSLDAVQVLRLYSFLSFDITDRNTIGIFDLVYSGKPE